MPGKPLKPYVPVIRQSKLCCSWMIFKHRRGFIMTREHIMRQIVKQQKAGVPKGICSICSANSYVLEAALEHGLETGGHVLIEATCNQVNQFGGYTGMKPADFQRSVLG